MNPSILTKDDILTILREGTMVHVQFEKRDGSLREMTCTVDPTLIPADKLPTIPWTSETPELPTAYPTDVNEAIKVLSSDTVIKAASNSPDVARVFDLQKGEWRSFRYDKVLAINTIED